MPLRSGRSSRARLRSWVPAVRSAALFPAYRLLLALLLTSSAAVAQFPPEIRGRVLEAGTGTPISGATVEVLGGALRTVAAPDGTFHLRGIVPGRRELRVAAFGYRERHVEVVAENGRTESLLVELIPDPVALDEVVARTTPRSALGAAILPRAEIQRSGARDLGELLQAQPGVTVTRRGGPGSPAAISIRGSSADQVLVLVDGTPLNSPLTGEADLSTLPLEVVERVTLLRGAQSASFGGRALAGAVLIETRRPTAREVAGRAGVGAWGERFGSVSLAERVPLGTGGLTGLVAGEWRSVTGDFDYRVPRVRGGGEAARANADSRLLSLLAQTRLEAGGGDLRARLEGLWVDRGMPGSIVQPSHTARQEQQRVSAGIGAQGSWLRTEWRIDLDAQEQRADFLDPEPPLGPAYREHLDVSERGATLSAAQRWGAVRLTAGAEARDLRFASSMLAPGAPDRQHQLAGWLQGQAAGAVRGWTADLQSALRLDHASRLDRPAVSPRLAAALSRHALGARLSLGSAFSPPSLADQFFQEGVLARPNPDLRPERVRWEVEGALEARGLRLGPTRLDAEFAAYRADVEGMILWFPDHRFVWQPDNFDVRRRGWEADARLRLPRNAEVRGTVSHAEVEYTGRVLSGQVRYRPRWTGTLAAAGEALGLRTELSTRFTGERRTVPSSELNSLPAFWLADLRLSRSATRGGWNGDLVLAVENLLDRDAAMLVDYPFPGRSWSLLVRLRQEPRRRVVAGDT